MIERPSFQTWTIWLEKSPLLLVMSGMKKIPPPHIEPENMPLDSRPPVYFVALGQVFASSMIPYCSCARWAGSSGPLGTCPTPMSFGFAALAPEMLHERIVGRKAYL